MELSTVAEVVGELQGLSITDGELTDDGLRLSLSDGRELLFIGEFIIYVGVLVPETMQ